MQPLSFKIDTWKNWHSVGMIAGAVISLLWQSLNPLLIFALASFAIFVIINASELKQLKPFAGYANWLTALRLLAICWALAYGLHWPPLTLGIFLTCAVLLDVADGYLARKFNQQTSFGQFFDMEVDAFFVMVMTLYFHVIHDVSAWLLVAGLLRYIYVIMMALRPKPTFQEKKKRYASFIAGTFFTILLVGLILPPPYMAIFLFIGMALIVISFSISFYEYFTHKVHH